VRGWFRREPKTVVPRTILIADGNATNRESTARRIESLGYQPLQSSSIADTLVQLAEVDPDFILLGFELDDCQGLEALGKIREMDPDLAVVMLAADLWDTRVADAMRQGAIAYLPRPFNQDDLREVLGRR
jgi:DNA-binding NtrC family response regulator